MKKFYLIIIFSFFLSIIHAQYVTESDTLFGNEWIDFSQQYYKISVSEDGIYRLNFSLLQENGIPVGEISKDQYVLMHNGQEHPIYISDGNYIEFYGRKNRGEIDKYLYGDAQEMQLNPEYSMFTDTSSYFLTWNENSSNERLVEVNTDLSDNTLIPEEYYTHREEIVFTNRHNKPTHGGSANVRYSHFDMGEGYGSNLAKRNNIDIPATRIYDDGLNAYFTIRFTTNATPHIQELSLNGDIKKTFDFFGYQLVQDSINIAPSELRASNRIRLDGTIDNFDRNTVSVVKLYYPREVNLDNATYFEMFVSANDQEKYFEVENFNGSSEAIIYDPVTSERIIPVSEDSRLKFKVSPANLSRELIIINTAESAKIITELKSVEFTDYTQMDHDYIIISHPMLMTGGVNNVQEYANYRASVAGGNFNPVVINVETLYDQFSYGINRHSFSVKNFVNYISRTWSDPKYVFIIGKGREYPEYRTADQINDPLNSDFTVPTYGYPGSDNMLVSKELSSVPVISSGRIVAKNQEDIEIYLDKVKEFEFYKSLEQSIEGKLWTKNIIHLSGGDPNIQNIIYSRLEEMRNIIENSIFSADVHTVRKYTSDPIQSSLSQDIINRINDGISILTFFGHSAVGTFDFSIEDPTTYNNKGKYPMIISLGCHSGNIHTSTLGVSEDFIIEKDRGAIAFLASSGTAYVSTQGTTGKKLYEFFGNSMYGESIGNSIQKVIDEFDDNNSLPTKSLMQQLTYHGDPSLKFPSYEGPDFVIDPKTVSISPTVPSPTEDDLKFTFEVANLGIVSEVDSIDIIITHYITNETLFKLDTIKIKAPSYKETFVIKLANPGIDGLGKNLIDIQLDYNNQVEELPDIIAESNNRLSDVQNGLYEFYILDNGIKNIYPDDKSILNKDCPFVLKTSTNNLFIEPTNFVFQIDTSAKFSSPALRVHEEVLTGGIVSWAPEFQPEEGTVYYWRVSPDSIDPNIGYLWDESSFIYLEDGEMGWNMSHYYQFQDVEKNTLGLRENRKWEFVREPHDMRFDLGVNTDPRRWVFYDGQPLGSLNPTDVGSFFGIHARNIYQWAIRNENPETINALPSSSKNIFAFSMENIDVRKSFIDVLESLPNETRVFIYTLLRNENSNLFIDQWQADSLELGYSVFTVLEGLGATKIRELNIKGTVPYLFVYDVNKGPVIELIGDDIYSDLETTITSDWLDDEGTFISEPIGKAAVWGKFNIDLMTESGDSVDIKIIGIKNNSNKDVLFQLNEKGEYDLSSIDPDEYPYLQIQIYANDSDNRTAAKIKNLTLNFQELPEFALNSNSNEYSFYSDTLIQGDNLKIEIPIENVSSSETSDSIEVAYSIVDINNNNINFRKKIPPIPSKSSEIFSLRHNTKNLQGDLQFILSLNENQIKEKYKSNNIGVKEFHVLRDQRNPILNVSFDGADIINGDYISSSPLILIQLKDENPYLLLNNPDLLQVEIYDPDGQKLNIDNQVNFIPATPDDNIASFELKPTFTKSGSYLMSINGKDVTNNLAGDLNYKIEFIVELEQKISNVLNYPNPFSSYTEFIFTLTGSEVPDDLKITIMNASGKIVKEIFKEELGPLKIGLNRTAYKWDGTDEFGQKLANGVYFYTVKTTSENNVKQLFNAEIDKYFKNGLGKMVILR